MERRDLVEQAVVAGAGRRGVLVDEHRVGQEAEGAEAVVDRDHHDAAGRRQAPAVIERLSG